MLSLPALPALGCPVCFSATEENRYAFMWTTVFMTFLPLGLIGGVIYWFRRKLRDHAEHVPRGL